VPKKKPRKKKKKGRQGLSKETKDAEKAERERRKRLEEKQELFDEWAEENEEIQDDHVILDIDKDTKDVLVEVDKAIVRHLKKHQREGIRFLYDSTIESIERLEEHDHESGCVLAHSMGLGKTFQGMISF